MEAFVINLDRRPDRMESVAGVLEQLGINFQRVSGVDARDVDVWQEVDEFKSRLYVDLKKRVPGSIGAYLSHRKVWQDVVARKLSQALVFEDDVIAADYDPAVLNLDLVTIGIDLLRLEEMNIPYASKLRTENFSGMVLGRHIVGNPTYGLAAYIVTLEGARTLLTAGKFWFNVDHFDIWERVYGLRSAVIRPAIFAQAVSVSDSKDNNQYPGFIHHIIGDMFSKKPPTLATTVNRLKWWLINAALDAISFVPRRGMLFYLSLRRPREGLH